MHEFAICESLVDIVLKELEKLDGSAQLVKTRVVIGALRQVVPETLTFAYETLTKATRAAGSQLEIQHLPASGRCKHCGWEGTLTSELLVCPECGEVGFDITQGTELYIDSLEIERA